MDKETEAQWRHLVKLLNNKKTLVYINGIEVQYGDNWVAIAGNKSRMAKLVKDYKLPINKPLAKDEAPKKG